MLGWLSAPVEIRVVALHAHLAGIFLLCTHLRVLAELRIYAVVHLTDRVVGGTGVRGVVSLSRRIVVVIKTTTCISFLSFIGWPLVTNAVPKWSGNFQATTWVDGWICKAAGQLTNLLARSVRVFLLATFESTTLIPTFQSLFGAKAALG